MDAKLTLGEPRAFISRSALLHNVSVLRQKIGPEVKLCAVLKADAYGHGAAIVADALCNFTSASVEAPAVDALAVATIDEAAALGPVPVPLMVLRPVENIYVGRERLRLETAIRAGWMLTVCSAEVVSDVARIAVSCGRRAAVQVMIDTGMTREGAAAEQTAAVLAAVEAQPALRLAGLYTHFASADVPGDTVAHSQMASFHALTHMAAWKYPQLLRHAANSGGLFFVPGSHMEMVRPGLSLYGIDPTGRPSVDRSLRPVLKWTAPLLMVRQVRAGQSVGYGGTWTAPRDTRLGLVPIGYADGYLRAFSNQARMIVHDQPVPVVGRVSMDSTMVDLGAVDNVHVGDTVTILDSDPLSPASVYALAAHAHTIPYEVLCRIGSRVTRVAVEPTDYEVQSEIEMTDLVQKRKSA